MEKISNVSTFIDIVGDLIGDWIIYHRKKADRNNIKIAQLKYFDNHFASVTAVYDKEPFQSCQFMIFEISKGRIFMNVVDTETHEWLTKNWDGLYELKFDENGKSRGLDRYELIMKDKEWDSYWKNQGKEDFSFMEE